MNGLKRKEKEIGLVNLDEIEEEVTAENVEKQLQKDSHLEIAIVMFLAGTVAMFAVSKMLLHIPLSLIAALIVIEVVLARLLKDSELWIHFVVMFIQLVLGLVFQKSLLLIIAAVYYFIMLIVHKIMEL